jgi:hypothetical protein
MSRDDTRRKNSILHLWQEKAHASLKNELRDGPQANAIRLKTIECIESARSRWRAIEAIQGGLDLTSFKAIDDDNRVDATGFRGANYITDAAKVLSHDARREETTRPRGELHHGRSKSFISRCSA